MPTVHFLGRVVPETQLIRFTVPPVAWTDPDKGVTVSAVVQVHDSAIDVECQLTYEPQQIEIERLLFRVEMLVNTHVDIASYMSGRGLTPCIEAVVLPNGERKPLHTFDHNLAPLCTLAFSDILEMALHQEPLLALAMSDLAATIERPLLIPINCARAIEAIGHLVTPGLGDDDEARWNGLNQNLNLTPDYSRFVTKLSRGPRHGEWPERFLGNDLITARNRAWTVMNRFLEFRKCGKIPLSSPEFPLL